MRVNPTVKIIAVVTLLNCALLLGLTQCSALKPEITTRADTTPSRYGSYLAARFAASERDAVSAAGFFKNALRFDPKNPDLLERALLSEVSGGDLDRAAAYAEQLIRATPNTRVGYMLIGVQAMRDGGFAKARENFGKVAGNTAAEITARIGIAYTHFSEGNMTEAKRSLDLLERIGGARAFALYHQAIMEDLTGDVDASVVHLEEASGITGDESLRIVQAYATCLARAGLTERAKKIYRNFLATSPGNPLAQHALAELEAGKMPARVIGNAREGMAETFYGIAASLSDDTAVEMPVFYLQLALALQPQHDLSLSLLGDRMETAERFEDAIAAYSRIRPGTALYLNAAQQIAQNWHRLKKSDEAMAVLKAAQTGTPDDADLFSAMGDIQRSDEEYADAVASYSRAIALIGTPAEQHWTLFYARGIAYEQSKRWAEAEADLKFALKLKPQQPNVMNYLAYSWVEQKRNIPEALEMLQRAVDLSPEDGFIIDSLGWAHYMLGDYQTALRYIEQAVLLVPSEPAINDHLGDVYWRLGRRLEAKFQWQHALTLGPDDDDVQAIRSKLASGLEDLPRAPAQAGEPARRGE